jgi:hypothetical protein
MSIVLGGTNPAVTFPDGTIQNSANNNFAGPAFSAYQSSAQTLSASTFTLVQEQTKEFDTGTCFNNTASPVTLNGLSVPAWAFMPNVAGYYQVSGGVFSSSVNSEVDCVIYKNASSFKRGMVAIGTPTNATVSALIYLNGTTDYIQMYAYFGTSMNTTASANATYFQAAMVRVA